MGIGLSFRHPLIAKPARLQSNLDAALTEDQPLDLAAFLLLAPELVDERHAALRNVVDAHAASGVGEQFCSLGCSKLAII